MAVARPLIGRFAAVPVTLIRMQATTHVKLQPFRAGRSYDLKLSPDGLVHPAEGPDFLGPNGASLRPAASPTLHEVLCNWRGNCILYKIPAGTPLPAGLTLLHEHSDHYSLQTTKPISLPDLQKAMTAFIAPFKLQQTREEFLETNDFYGS